MGRKATQINIISDNIVFEINNNHKLSMKFAEYHLQNFDDMPCFRGGGVQGDSYFCVFFGSAKEKIDIFIKENEKFEVNRFNDFKEYK